MQESTHEWGGVEGLGKGHRGGGHLPLGGGVLHHKGGWGRWVYGLGNDYPPHLLALLGQPVWPAAAAHMVSLYPCCGDAPEKSWQQRGPGSSYLLLCP